jgi:hypothetical protein
MAMAMNLKLLGLALLAALAIGAVAAQSAAAEVEMTFTSAVEPTELTATGGPHEWRLGGKTTIKCAKATASGTLASTTSDQMDLIPEYKECKLNAEIGSFTATWENPGCKTDFDSDTSWNALTEHEDGAVNLNCGPLSHMTFSALVEGELVQIEFFDTHPEGVPVNQELHGAIYSVVNESLGPYEILIEAHTFGVKFLCTGEKCPKLSLKQGTNENGTTHGSYLVKGYADTAHTQKVSLGLSVP